MAELRHWRSICSDISTNTVEPLTSLMLLMMPVESTGVPALSLVLMTNDT
jgi:hypothetical protein